MASYLNPLAFALVLSAAVFAPAVVAQDAGSATSASNAASDIPAAMAARYAHAKWTYPSMADVYVEGKSFGADIMIDCGVQASGDMTDCYVNSLNSDDDADTEDGIAAAYMRVAKVAPGSVDGGIKAGDRVQLHYMWHDLPHSDLADAARLPSISKSQRGKANSWHYPTGTQMANSYPLKAAHDRKNGLAVIYCEAKSDGSIKSCQILVEYPEDYGFGDATVSLFEKYAYDEAGPGDKVEDGDYRLFTYRWVQ